MRRAALQAAAAINCRTATRPSRMKSSPLRSTTSSRSSSRPRPSRTAGTSAPVLSVTAQRLSPVVAATGGLTYPFRVPRADSGYPHRVPRADCATWPPFLDRSLSAVLCGDGGSGGTRGRQCTTKPASTARASPWTCAPVPATSVPVRPERPRPESSEGGQPPAGTRQATIPDWCWRPGHLAAGRPSVRHNLQKPRRASLPSTARSTSAAAFRAQTPYPSAHARGGSAVLRPRRAHGQRPAAHSLPECREQSLVVLGEGPRSLSQSVVRYAL